MGKLITGANLPLPAPFNAGSADPLDTRQFIETKADLTNPDTYGGVGTMCFVYPGLKTYVLETNEEYTYMGPFVKNEGTLKTEVAKLDNWVKTADKTSAGGLALRWQNNKIQLVSMWTNSVISEIDGSEFIKDGLLDDVSLQGNNLIFTFNTDAGKLDITVDLTKFIDTYTAGNGININNREISVDLEEVTAFTTVRTDVNNIKNTKLSHIKDDAPITTEADKVALNYETYLGTQYGSTGTIHTADIPAATADKAGVMSAADKNKLEETDSLVDSLLYGQDGIDVGNAVLVNKNTLEFVSVNPNDLNNYSKAEYEPIGVIAIPTAHNVYGTSECGVMALMSASLTTPNTGLDSNAKICWGNFDVDIRELPNLSGCSSYGNQNTWTSVLFYPNDANMPSDQDSFGQKLLNPNGEQNSWYYYQDDNHHVPSPYNSDRSFNPDYSNMEIGANRLGDFDGKRNTEILCNLATAQADWKTAATITNNSQSGYSPAACCCWRYYTLGTTQGDWYLPANGEIGYCCVRFKSINLTITALSNWYGENFVLLESSNTLLSSSEVGSRVAGSIVLRDGRVSYELKTVSLQTRPFLRLNLPQREGVYTELDKKVDKVEGKGLSTNDYTNEEKQNLANVKTKLYDFLNTLDSSDTSINKWKEVESFLQGITDTKTLTGLLNDLKTEIGEDVTNKLVTKADIDDLSNVLAEQVIDDPLKTEIETLTREEIKKDLFIDMWNEACGSYGTYNAETGYFELNGLIDITYEEALAIYNACNKSLYQNEGIAHFRIRTNIPIDSDWSAILERYAQNNQHVQVLNVPMSVHGGNLFNMCYNCTNLKKIYGLHILSKLDDGVFYNCKKLETVEVKDINSNISFAQSPLLTKESLSYLVTYAKQGDTFIITVHPDVYAKLTGDTTNAAASALTPEEAAQWQLLVTDAAAKNISFATV